MKVHFDEPPTGSKVESGRSVPQDLILDLQCAIMAMLEQSISHMNQMSDTMERIEQAILDGTEKADEGISASKEHTKAMNAAAKAAEKLAGVLTRDGTD